MAENLNVSLILSLVDRMSRPTRGVAALVDRLDAKFGGLRRSAELAGRGVGQIGAGLAKGTAAVAGYGAAVAALSTQLLAPAAQFEKFQTILQTTEGSMDAAREAMSWVREFAVKTPFDLDQVMAAFVQLRAYGLDPTNGLLKDLGDASSAMGKDVMQAVEAIADAVTGENERLKEFGIKAAKAGNEVVYSYTVDGVKKEIAAAADSAVEIEGALRTIFRERFAGSMELQAGTWEGMISNLKDLWSKFQLQIMGGGLFDFMKGELQAVLDQANRLAADGTLQRWANEIGDSIKEVLLVLKQLAIGLARAAQAAGPLIVQAKEALGGWNEFGLALVAIPFAGVFAQIASGVAMVAAAFAANPILLTITAIGVAVYAIYDNWDGIVGYFQDKLDAVYKAFDEGFLTGLIALLSAFDPVSVFIDAFTGLVAWLTGYRIDFAWADILPDWSWSDIIPDLPSFGGLFGGEEEPAPARQAGGPLGANPRGRRGARVDASPSALTRGGGARGGDVITDNSKTEITVNAAPGQSEERIAEKVAEKVRTGGRGARGRRRLYDAEGAE